MNETIASLLKHKATWVRADCRECNKPTIWYKKGEPYPLCKEHKREHKKELERQRRVDYLRRLAQV